MTYAGCASRGRRRGVTSPGSCRASSSASTGSSSTTCDGPAPGTAGSDDAVAIVVITRSGRASASMNPIRSAGYAGSTGRNAAPDLATPSHATNTSADLSITTATSRSGPAPSEVRCPASRVARSSSSAYDSATSPHATASAPGARAACASNNSGNVTSCVSGCPALPSDGSGRRGLAMVILIPMGDAGRLDVERLSVGHDRLLGDDRGGTLGGGRVGGIGRRGGRGGPLAPPGHGGGGQAEQSEPRAEQHEAEPAGAQHEPDQDERGQRLPGAVTHADQPLVLALRMRGGQPEVEGVHAGGVPQLAVGVHDHGGGQQRQGTPGGKPGRQA